MNHPKYTASLSQAQGRSGYSISFRHPVRRAGATGKPGLKVRRGLSTRDKEEADRLLDELNLLLGDVKYHDPAARSDAERRFDPRVVDIFFDKMVPEATDFVALRDAAIALPKSTHDGYRRVLLLGTTGAGKTTLVRQLMGTDPRMERFPSTSAAKTTIHDTEIVFAHGDWRAVVTFVSRDEVREYLSECISDAVLAAIRDADDTEVLRRLLNHANQRFRFSHVLGDGPTSTFQSSDLDDDDDDAELERDEDLLSKLAADAIDMTGTEELLADTVGRLRGLGSRHRDGVYATLEVGGDEDKRVADELLEEELDHLLRDDEEFHQVADVLMEEIEKRFDLLPSGEVKKTRQGWPLSWSSEWPYDKRAEFISEISRFSSNYAPLFGQLLTPMVNGVRVAGPFSPVWNGTEVPKLVLLDGEGLGHTPNSSSTVSTAMSERIHAADAVLLVDNATQPMQAAPLAAMREVEITGNGRKLIIVFTHFEEVKGDNLRDSRAKKQHVLASAENVLATLGKELGLQAERTLRHRVQDACFFLGGIHAQLSAATTSRKGTVMQLRMLLNCIECTEIEPPELVEAHPIYDRLDLVLPIRRAATDFRNAWRSRLGIESTPGVAKEHWATVKALSRRLGTMHKDEYGDLKPVAELCTELKKQIYRFISKPLDWEGAEPADQEKKEYFDAFANTLSLRLLEVCTRRVWNEREVQWRNAYYLRGTGSTSVRARVISDEIYEPAAPVIDITPSPDHSRFRDEIVREVENVAREINAALV